MDDLERAPAEIRDLVAGLRAAAFTARRSRVGDRFNQVVEWWDADGTVAVRVSADRGRWWVAFGPAGTTDLHDPDVWAACLDGHPIGTEVSSLADRVAFVRRRAAEAVRAIDGNPDLAECLRRAGESRARARLGLPPAVD